MAVKKETTGERDLKYSRWHRTLPENCLAMDIDWVEWRDDKPKALIEVSKINPETVGPSEDPYKKTLYYVLRRTYFQRKCLLYIANKLNIPAFIVVYDDELKNFLVCKIDEDLNKKNWKYSKPHDVDKLKLKFYTQEQYKEWLINL